MNITANELGMLEAIWRDEFQQSNPIDQPIWSWSVCGSRSNAGILSSLCRKNFAWAVTEADPDQSTCGITLKGAECIMLHSADEKMRKEAADSIAEFNRQELEKAS